MDEKDIKEALLRLKSGYPQRSFLYYGSDKHKNSETLQQIRNIAIPFTNCIISINSNPSENFSEDLLRGLKRIRPDFIPPPNSADLTELFISAGQQAKDSGQSICILIENLHNVKKAELKELCSAISRANQLNLPIIAFMTGSPSILHKLGRARSYSERLFEYIKLISIYE